MAQIHFNDLNVREITESSGLFSGENLQVKWNHRKKTTEGFGTLNGEYNQVTHCDNVVIKKGMQLPPSIRK